MTGMFGVQKQKGSLPSVGNTSDRITRRGEIVEEKIRKLDAQLSKCKEQIKRTRPGPAQEAIKTRAMRVLKQKRVYEGQRDILCDQTFELDKVAYAAELKDSKQTLLRDEMMDLMGILVNRRKPWQELQCAC